MILPAAFLGRRIIQPVKPYVVKTVSCVKTYLLFHFEISNIVEAIGSSKEHMDDQ